MDDFVTIYYWVRLAVLAIVTLLALVTAIRMSARRKYRPWREVVFAALAATLFVALSVIVGVHYSVVWAAMVGVLGFVIGFFVNRGVGVSSDDGRATLRTSPLAAWVWFVAIALTLAALLFGEAYLFAVSMLVLAFAVGLVAGQTAGVLTGAQQRPAPVAAAEAGAV